MDPTGGIDQHIQRVRGAATYNHCRPATSRLVTPVTATRHVPQQKGVAPYQAGTRPARQSCRVSASAAATAGRPPVCRADWLPRSPPPHLLHIPHRPAHSWRPLPRQTPAYRAQSMYYCYNLASHGLILGADLQCTKQETALWHPMARHRLCSYACRSNTSNISQPYQSRTCCPPPAYLYTRTTQQKATVCKLDR